MAPPDELPSDSAHVTSGRHETVLVPPQLPSFLSATFDLQPIVGAPNNEEVKLVHAAMRALNSFLASGLRESVVDLSMELSQHLFDVQMACHREKYAVGIFPNDIVYTPPSLPSHIPINLEPVVGPPSDDELRLAHAALRVSDSLLSVPSLPHLDLNVQLSQHLFDLQLARHIQRSTRSPSLARANRPLSQRHSTTPAVPPGQTTTHPSELEVIQAGSVDASVQPGTNTSGESAHGVTGSDDVQHLDSARHAQPSTSQGFEERNGFEDDRKLLVEMAETLKNMNRVLIGTQHSLARGFNSASANDGSGFDLGTHSLINEKGETPEMHGLIVSSKTTGGYSTWRRTLDLNGALLPQYLRFYGIGAEVLEEGEKLKIKPGREEDAKALMLKHLRTPLM